jgi:transcription elongation factor Elf1
MRENIGLTVYFTCQRCNLVYQAKQVLAVEPANGMLDCVKCGTRVYTWTGLYDYLRWKPVAGGKRVPRRRA